MELWYKEKQTKDQIMNVRVEKTLHHEETKYQTIDVYETPEYGTILVLDGYIQTTDVDEFIYAEMITHVPLFSHPNPKKVLVVGGGDGGPIREIIKHSTVEEAHICEIDERVIEVSKEFLPQISSGYSDPKVTIFIKDGIEHVKNSKNEYDIIIVDSPDPVGPAVNLFTDNFYKLVYEALKEDGIFVAQTESPYFNKDILKNSYDNMKALFPITKTYLAVVPTYQSGQWTFTMGSKKYDPVNVENMRKQDFKTRYYNQELHKASFALPNFIKELLED